MMRKQIKLFIKSLYSFGSFSISSFYGISLPLVNIVNDCNLYYIYLAATATNAINISLKQSAVYLIFIFESGFSANA